MASILCLSGKYGNLLDMITFVAVLFYVLTIFGVYILRHKQPNAERPYRAFGYPIVPALYMLIGLGICFILLYTKTFNTGMGLLIAALGVPVYLITRRKK